MNTSNSIVQSIIALVASILGLLSAGHALAEPSFTHETESGRILLNASTEKDGYVQSHHSLSLQRGTNKVRVSMDSLELSPDSLLLVVGSPEVRVKRVTFPNDRTAIWVLESAVASVVPATVYGRATGISNTVSYRAYVNSEKSHLRLQERVTLVNRSGMTADEVWVGLGFGAWLKTSLEGTETKQFRNYEKEQIPYSRLYRLEDTQSRLDREFSPLPVYYVFSNTPSSHLGDRALRDGKVRFYSSEDQSGVFLGEARMDFVPLGDSVAVSVGKSAEVRAKRRIVERDRSNVRRNNRRRIQLYDETRTIEFTVKNTTENNARIRLVESIDGEWHVREASVDYRTVSTRKLALEPTLKPDEERTFRVTIELNHVMPDHQ